MKRVIFLILTMALVGGCGMPASFWLDVADRTRGAGKAVVDIVCLEAVEDTDEQARCLRITKGVDKILAEGLAAGQTAATPTTTSAGATP